MGNSKTNFKLVFKVCMTFKAVNHTIPQYSTIAQKYYLNSNRLFWFCSSVAPFHTDYTAF